jgi:hypothetical protein
MYSIAKNLSHLFLHAPAMPLGAALQPRFDCVFEISHYKLRHDCLPKFSIS